MNRSDIAYIYSLPWGVSRDGSSLNKHFAAEIVALWDQLSTSTFIRAEVAELRSTLKQLVVEAAEANQTVINTLWNLKVSSDMWRYRHDLQREANRRLWETCIQLREFIDEHKPALREALIPVLLLDEEDDY